MKTANLTIVCTSRKMWQCSPFPYSTFSFFRYSHILCSNMGKYCDAKLQCLSIPVCLVLHNQHSLSSPAFFPNMQNRYQGRQWEIPISCLAPLCVSVQLFGHEVWDVMTQGDLLLMVGWCFQRTRLCKMISCYHNLYNESKKLCVYPRDIKFTKHYFVKQYL